MARGGGVARRVRGEGIKADERKHALKEGLHDQQQP